MKYVLRCIIDNRKKDALVFQAFYKTMFLGSFTETKVAEQERQKMTFSL